MGYGGSRQVLRLRCFGDGGVRQYWEGASAPARNRSYTIAGRTPLATPDKLSFANNWSITTIRSQ